MTQAGSSDKDKSDADSDANAEEDATKVEASSEPLILSEEDEASENSEESDSAASDEVVDATEIEADAVEDAEVIEEVTDEMAADSEDEPSDAVESPEELSETEPEPEPEVVADTPAPPPPSQNRGSGGFIPLVLGGAAAALIGYLIAQYTGPEDNSAELTQSLSEQSDRIAALEAELANATSALEVVPSAEDLTAVADAATASDRDLQTALGSTSDGLTSVEDRLDALGEELAVVAARPIPEAFDADALDEELRAFRADLSDAIETAKADIATARAEAEAIRAEADAGMTDAAVGALLVDLQSALETGQPFDAVASDLSSAGIEVPDALSSVAAEGVMTLAALTEGFPGAARQALTASIQSETPESAGDRVMAFLRVQSGARSLVPREGEDPDAVLSRVEAAIGAGDLDTALAEIGSLPDAGQAELAGWAATATTRRDALAAAEALRSATMN